MLHDTVSQTNLDVPKSKERLALALQRCTATSHHHASCSPLCAVFWDSPVSSTWAHRAPQTAAAARSVYRLTRRPPRSTIVLSCIRHGYNAPSTSQTVNNLPINKLKNLMILKEFKIYFCRALCKNGNSILCTQRYWFQ